MTMESRTVRHMDAGAIDAELRRWLDGGEPDEYDPQDPTTFMLRFLYEGGGRTLGAYVLLPLKRDAFTITVYDPFEAKEQRYYAQAQFTPAMLTDAKFSLVDYLLHDRAKALTALAAPNAASNHSAGGG